MTYEEAKAIKKQLDEKNLADSDRLKMYDEYKKEMGLLPDYIRQTAEYQKLKNEFEKSFSELRNFNVWYVKQFKKEIRADRKNRFPQKKAN